MRVVVTGALGHIGSRLIRELANAWPGAEIVMLDNLATERYASLYDLPAAGRYEFIEADVLTADLDASFAGADAVIHLAALTNGASERNSTIGCNGSTSKARSAWRARAPRSVSGCCFPSTTSVYGVPHGVVSEDCRRKTSAAESVCRLETAVGRDLGIAGREEGLRFVIFRMGTIFGPSVGMRFHTAVNQFCWRAVAGRPIEVWRTASHQFRPYLDLSDAVRAMIFMLRRRQFDGAFTTC